MQHHNILTGTDIAGKRALVISFKEKSIDHEDENLKELESLACTLGLNVAKSLLIRHPDPVHPATYIGKGKIQEISKMIQEETCDVVIFEKELTPVQQRNLEESFGVAVIDRTVLILLIFGKHAHTLEGKLQVELAQMSYLLPRLVGSSGRLSRLGGTIGTRGPGEQKLEVYRRRARERIRLLNARIKEIEKHRNIIRETRQKKNLPVAAIMGYTNAGKSTLLNALTHKQDAIVDNKLFATLDPLTRIVFLGDGIFCLVSDTVGLLSSLPHHLIAAFRATLEELKYAHLLLCLIDASGFSIEKQINTIDNVLEIMSIQHKPRINVFNKIDLIDETEISFLERNYPDSIFISAKTGSGLYELKNAIKEIVRENAYFRI
ncbi:MAG TPA: GTPase HflX [bacterium]|nr:GTPase HflX [bacterium]HOL34543.1 GTPase HflX [bacterium]HPP07529.1 GTPase HflX [bacterium]